MEVSCRFDVYQALQAFADTKPQLGHEESVRGEKVCMREKERGNREMNIKKGREQKMKYKKGKKRKGQEKKKKE